MEVRSHCFDCKSLYLFTI